MNDQICQRIAWLLPKRVVTFAIQRVLLTVVPPEIHPDDIGWFEALQRFDPLPDGRTQLTLVRGRR